MNKEKKTLLLQDRVVEYDVKFSMTIDKKGYEENWPLTLEIDKDNMIKVWQRGMQKYGDPITLKYPIDTKSQYLRHMLGEKLCGKTAQKFFDSIRGHKVSTKDEKPWLSETYELRILWKFKAQKQNLLVFVEETYSGLDEILNDFDEPNYMCHIWLTPEDEEETYLWENIIDIPSDECYSRHGIWKRKPVKPGTITEIDERTDEINSYMEQEFKHILMELRDKQEMKTTIPDMK